MFEQRQLTLTWIEEIEIQILSYDVSVFPDQ
jgi:hypothetical protein